MSKNITKVLVMADNHGNHGNQDTLQAILDFKKDFKPDHTWHLGDNWNFACLRKGVNIEDMEGAGVDLAEDVDAGCEWLAKLRPDMMNEGNHDARVWDRMRATDSRTKLKNLDKIYRTMKKMYRQCGVKRFAPYTARKNVLKIGPVAGAHGFGGNFTRTWEALNQGPGTALVCGHWHTAMQMMMPRHGGGVMWLCGASCDLEMDYNEKQLGSLKHQNGFMAFIIKDRHYVGRQAHKFNGEWLMPFST